MKEGFCFVGIGDCSKQETAEKLVNGIVTKIIISSTQDIMSGGSQTLNIGASGCAVTIEGSTITQVQTISTSSFMSTIKKSSVQNEIAAAILAAQKKYGFSLTGSKQSQSSTIVNILKNTTSNTNITKNFNNPTQILKIWCDNGGSVTIKNSTVSEFQSATVYSAFHSSFYSKILQNVNEKVTVKQTSSLFPNLTGIARIIVFGLIALFILLILLLVTVVLIKEA